MNTCTFQSPLGAITICENANQLTNLDIAFGKTAPELSEYEMHSDFLYEVYCQLQDYFAGRRKCFDLDLNCQGTLFQKRVWQELQKIPYGETRSYGDIAVGIGNEKAVRAVGQANGKNPIPIIIPCHRVIHKNGDITGYTGGMEIKEYLLKLEGV